MGLIFFQDNGKNKRKGHLSKHFTKRLQCSKPRKFDRNELASKFV